MHGDIFVETKVILFTVGAKCVVFNKIFNEIDWKKRKKGHSCLGNWSPEYYNQSILVLLKKVLTEFIGVTLVNKII